ncbi:MAG: LPS export ABC transporter permease LptG [Gammaproteobacteria bacterium]|nr:LPS export ABC transporter permease LptG [Gammaproteobacteria bacterium]
MRRLVLYLVAACLGGILLVLFGLAVLFDLFTMLAELEHLGQGSYGVAQMLFYILLTTPRLLYELMPTAGLIGTLVALGGLASRGELVAMRAAGVSHWQISASVVTGAGLLFIVAWGVGEWLAPLSETYAQEVKSSARGRSLAVGGRLWVRDGNSFVNVGGVDPDGMPRQLQIYRVDDDRRLSSVTQAKGGRLERGVWTLQQLRRTSLSADQAVVHRAPAETWETGLSPDLFRTAVLDPQRMSAVALHRYSGYLEDNGLAAGTYRLALWGKLLQPVNAIVMVVLALPLVFGLQRMTNTPQRLFVGVLLGLGFHIVNQSVGYMALAYEAPLAVMLLPTLVVGGVALQRLRKLF